MLNSMFTLYLNLMLVVYTYYSNSYNESEEAG